MSSDNVNIQVSYKAAIISMVLILSTLLGGNAGLNFLIGPNYENSNFEQIISKVDGVHVQQSVIRSELTTLKDTDKRRVAELSELRELIRQNGVQLNQLLGKFSLLLKEQRE